MSDFWSDSIQQAGLALDADAPALDPSTTWITPLVAQQVLRLHGPDAEKFLQGQVTCDVRQLSTSHSLIGANCTPKGNVISAFRLLALDEHDLLIRINCAIAESTLANLRKYIVFSKAELSDSDNWQGVGIGGPGAEALVAAQFGQAPQQVNQQVVANGAAVVRVKGEQPRFEIWANAEQITLLWAALIAEAQPVPPQHWLAEEIRAGLVQLSAEMVDSYLPHMLNLQAVDGISFTKGCYTGQEVVARLQYRGKLKKLIYAARCQTEVADSGSGIHTPQRLSVGKVLASVRLENGEYLLQAVINRGEAEQGDLRLHTQDGPELTLLPHPYTIDPALFDRG